MAEVKFCGLTRVEDAAYAATLGASYVGAIFAGGPRQLTAERARLVLDAARAPRPPRRVGVFGDQSGDVIGDIAREAALDVVQLHGDCSAAVVRAVRKRFMGEVWRVVRVRGDVDETSLRDAGADVDAVVVDALVDSALGGTGVAVNWERLAAAFGRVGRPARLVLAGGLRPENVVRAVGVVAPDVVDVSSGVESSVGIKDHALMRAFADAAARGGE